MEGVLVGWGYMRVVGGNDSREVGVRGMNGMIAGKGGRKRGEVAHGWVSVYG